MELILWRHAEAEENSHDLIRPLTEKGKDQSQASASWLQEHLPDHYQIWVSEAKRSQETAFFLNRPTTIIPMLNPSSRVHDLLGLLKHKNNTHALVWVGHQPWIGQLASYLLNGNWNNDACLPVRKGAFWWFNLQLNGLNNPSAKLKVVMTPSILLNKNNNSDR